MREEIHKVNVGKVWKKNNNIKKIRFSKFGQPLTKGADPCLNSPSTSTLRSKIYAVFCLRKTLIVYNTDEFKTMLGGIEVV